MPVVGTHASFSADEGAAITQARNLARGDGWIVDHPLPQVDPEGANYPLELSSRGPNGVAPFAKHPLYALVLAGAERVGGINAMVALSMLGTLAAAALGAALASRMGGPGLARPTLWALGLGSPLLFDGYLVVAHTIGAALAAAAVLVAVIAIERRRAAARPGRGAPRRPGRALPHRGPPVRRGPGRRGRPPRPPAPDGHPVDDGPGGSRIPGRSWRGRDWANDCGRRRSSADRQSQRVAARAVWTRSASSTGACTVS